MSRAPIKGPNNTRVISSHNGLWQFQRRPHGGGKWRSAGPPTDKATALANMGPRDLRPEQEKLPEEQAS